MIKLKKGSQAAKDYMAKIRAMRKGVKKAAKKVKRKLSGNPRRETQHKDTKSHNVNIRVLSGVNQYTILNNLEKELKRYINMKDFYIKALKGQQKSGVTKLQQKLNLKFANLKIKTLKNMISQQKRLIKSMI